MKIWMALLGVFALLVVIFALQNSHPVPIAFLFWTVRRVSLALLIILAVLLGAVAGIFAGFWDARRRNPRSTIRSQSAALGTTHIGLGEPPLAAQGMAERPAEASNAAAFKKEADSGMRDGNPPWDGGGIHGF
jgi:uncharacterized integral membrane protein